jgi:3-phenylpropionate/cinnamic acid dioxygenase small subunit
MTTAETFGADAIERPADDLAIRNLVARLAHLADMSGPDELDEYVGLFTEDATWGMPDNQRTGRADILDAARERRLSGQQGPGTNSRHVITTQAVRFDGADSAVSEAYFLFVADTTTTPTIRFIGHYHDLLRREGGTWKLARREITPG